MLSIIKSCLLHSIKDKKNLIFLLVFPIFLVILLGNLLSGAYFTSGTDLKPITVSYVDSSNDNTKKIFDTFKDVTSQKSSTLKINFVKINSLDEGKNKVRIDKQMLLHLNGDKIDFYSNDQSIVKSSFVFSTIKAISNKYNAVTEMFKINPAKAGQIIKSDSEQNYFNFKTIPSKSIPNAMSYYGIAEIGLMIFYFIQIPILYIQTSRKVNIQDRIIIAGISPTKYYFGCFIGFSIYAFCSSMLSAIACKYLANVNYGSNLFLLPLATLPFVGIIIGIGTLCATIFKDKDKSQALYTLINLAIIILNFLGGGYVVMDGDMGPVLNVLTNMSPLRWFNKSLFRSIYASDNSVLIQWLIIGGAATAILMLLIYIFGKREERYYE